MAGSMADLFLVLRFKAERFEEEKVALVAFTQHLGMTTIFNANFEKVRSYLE
jgi:hypothetical protein